MLCRSALRRQAQSAIHAQKPAQRRGLAAPASGSFLYDAGEASGIKIAARDVPGPVATVQLVARAGTRYEPLPGLSEGLERYAFKGTSRRSTLRIQRESELLGAALQSYHSRENLVVGAKFLRDDLPYFVELLAEISTMPQYQEHVFHEEIYPVINLARQRYLANTTAMATDSVHGLAFHRGLGVPLHPTSTVPVKKYVDVDSVAEFAASAYAKPSIAIVANGTEQETLSKWVKEFFGNAPAQAATPFKSEQSKYYGGEERIAHASGNSLVLAFPGSSSPTGPFYKPEVAVLAALLGGKSTIKWSSGFSLLGRAAANFPSLSVDTKSIIYTDAGLLTITLTGSGADIKGAAPKVVEALKGAAQNIGKEDFAKAKALAKFRELEYGHETQAAMELTGAGLLQGGKPYQIDDVAKSIDAVTPEKVKAIAKEALAHKASVSAVGDLFLLPYAEEIGLTV